MLNSTHKKEQKQKKKKKKKNDDKDGKTLLKLINNAVYEK